MKKNKINHAHIDTELTLRPYIWHNHQKNLVDDDRTGRSSGRQGTCTSVLCALSRPYEFMRTLPVRRQRDSDIYLTKTGKIVVATLPTVACCLLAVGYRTSFDTCVYEGCAKRVDKLNAVCCTLLETGNLEEKRRRKSTINDEKVVIILYDARCSAPCTVFADAALPTTKLISRK